MFTPTAAIGTCVSPYAGSRNGRGATVDVQKALFGPRAPCGRAAGHWNLLGSPRRAAVCLHPPPQLGPSSLRTRGSRNSRGATVDVHRLSSDRALRVGERRRTLAPSFVLHAEPPYVDTHRGYWDLRLSVRGASKEPWRDGRRTQALFGPRAPCWESRRTWEPSWLSAQSRRILTPAAASGTCVSPYTGGSKEPWCDGRRTQALFGQRSHRVGAPPHSGTFLALHAEPPYVYAHRSSLDLSLSVHGGIERAVVRRVDVHRLSSDSALRVGEPPNIGTLIV